MAKDNAMDAKRKAFAGEFRALLEKVARRLEYGETLGLNIGFTVNRKADNPKKYEAVAQITVKPAEL